MRLTVALAGVAFALAASSAAEAARPPVALAVSPARVALVAPASRTIELRNVGTERVAVDVGRILPREWVSIRPSRLVLRGGSRALLTLRASARARPGDHQFFAFLNARPVDRTRVAVRLRVGVRVRIRVPGRLLRSISAQGLRVRRSARVRVLLVSVANRGNVTEQLRGRLSVTLYRRGRFISRLRSRAAGELLPGAGTVVKLPYRGRVRGPVMAVVKVRSGGERRYRIRL